MRRVVAAILSAILPSCSKTDLSAQCAAALVASARDSKIEATAAGPRATLAGVELRVGARLEEAQQKGSQWVVGIAVTTSTGSGQSLSAGSVGVGTSRADALDTAIAEWVQLAGVAVVRSHVLKERSSERFALEGAVVYPGATGIRGPEEPGWSKEDHSRLLGLLIPVLADITAEQPHSVSLTLVVDPVGEVQGDCRLDGVPSASLLEAARTFPWPRLKSSYMFKQYYVAEMAR